MPLYAKIVVIKRSGVEGAHFPLTSQRCLIGRGEGCDIRITLPSVAEQHCELVVNQAGEVFLNNLDAELPTRLNEKAVQGTELLHHGDIITVVERSFRLDFPPRSPHRDGGFLFGDVRSAPSPKPPAVNCKILSPTKKAPVVTPAGKTKIPVPKMFPTKTPKTPTLSSSGPTGRASRIPVKSSAMTAPKAAVKKERKSSVPTGLLLPGSPPRPEIREVLENLLDEVVERAVSPKRRSTGSLGKVSAPGTPVVLDIQTFRASVSPRASPVLQALQAQKSSPTAESSPPSKASPVKTSPSPKSSPSKTSPSAQTPKGSPAHLPPPMSTGRRSLRKSVTFGAALSPELFDKSLPVMTPIKKGAKPHRGSSL